MKDQITNDLRMLRVIAEDIQDENELIDTLTEPDLIYQSSEELLKLVDEYNELCETLEKKLGEYVKHCNKTNEPVDINLYKIYKGLKSGGNRCTLTPRNPKKD